MLKNIQYSTLNLSAHENTKTIQVSEELSEITVQIWILLILNYTQNLNKKPKHLKLDLGFLVF